MWVKIIKGCAGYSEPGGRSPFRFSRGQEVDINERLALSLIKSGIAEKVYGKKEKPVAVPDIAEVIIQEIKAPNTTHIKRKRKRRV